MDKYFFTPEDAKAVDIAVERDGVTIGMFSKQTFSDLAKEYPTLQLGSYSDYEIALEARLKTVPEAISEEEFDEALGALPPLDLCHSSSGVSFKMSELLSGPFTRIYAQCDGRHWMFVDRCTLSHSQIMDRIPKKLST